LPDAQYMKTERFGGKGTQMLNHMHTNHLYDTNDGGQARCEELEGYTDEQVRHALNR